MKKKGQVGVLLSGRGSNFEAIYRYTKMPGAHFEVGVVISDKKDALGLEKAREYGLNAFHVSLKKWGSRAQYESHIVEIMNEYGVELVCLAGYMRIVGETLLNAFPGRVMNIHPALLPAFRGVHAQQQALDYGVRVSGCTVHFVDSDVDTGPVITQRVVDVLPGDDVESLSQRILQEEHKVYAQAIQWFFDRRLIISGRKVILLP